MKGDRWLVVSGLLLAGGLFAIANASNFSRPWSFTKSIAVEKAGQDRGYYYRFKASYAYKGEPLNFDIVVGCNVSVTTYKDNGQTVEVGIAPMVYGLKMNDGRGVVVHPPQACEGETTENGQIPALLLPLVVTYENADRPWFGLAYASEDAYESPISELKFFGATIGKATFEEWQEWRRMEAPKNFVTYELLGINAANKWDHVRWKPGYRAMGSVCTGFSWVKLPESVREAIRPYWPASKPRYWYPNGEAHHAFRSAGDYRQGTVPFEGRPLREYYGWPGDHGLPRHTPGSNRGRVSGGVYPAASDLAFNRLDDAGELSPEIKAKIEKSFAEVTVDPKLKGFAYCDRVENIDNTPPDISFNQRMKDRINGEPISEDALTWHQWSFDVAFERDEYVFFYKRYLMVNILFGGL